MKERGKEHEGRADMDFISPMGRGTWGFTWTQCTCPRVVGLRIEEGSKFRKLAPMLTIEPHAIAKNRRTGTPSSEALLVFSGQKLSPFAGANFR